MKPKTITLEGDFALLKPLEFSDLDELAEVGLEPDLWRWTASHIKTRADLEGYIREALEKQEAGTALPFVIVDKKTDKYAGSTRFGAINLKHRRLEIGWTWIGLAWQRTAINTETKFLLLKHAFEDLRAIRVEFKTDVLNSKSQRAIERIGAKEEGVLRQHIINDDGRIRDTVYYSILENEWPSVKEKLIKKLNRC